MLKNRAIGAQQHKLEKDKFYLQKDSLWFEFFKHMTTLNTGVVILLATLLEKSLLVPKFSFLTSISFVLFCLSLFGCVVGMVVVLPYRSEKKKELTGLRKKLTILNERMIEIMAALFAMGGFLVGLFIIIFNTSF